MSEKMYRSTDPEMDEVELSEGGLSEPAEQGDNDDLSSVTGTIHISEEVIMELAKKTLTTVTGVQPASPGIASKLGIGRKASDGIRVSVEEKFPPAVTVDVYLMVKYGLRIPDVAWDVQEAIKNSLEQYTGYDVRAVNINVQGIYFKDKPIAPPEDEKTEENDEIETKAPPFVDDEDDLEAFDDLDDDDAEAEAADADEAEPEVERDDDDENEEVPPEVEKP